MKEKIEVIIVDDENSVCMSLSEHLLDQGYNVSYYLTAEEALQQLEMNKPDIMIVDIRLPGIDGTKLIVKASKIYSGIKYLIHTGSVAFSLPDYLTKLGLTPDHVIKKPVKDLNIFNDKIEMLINI